MMTADSPSLTTPEHAFHERLRIWLRGHIDAVDACHILYTASHCWDDFIDKDHLVEDEHINAVMWSLLISLPENIFYRTYGDQLRPILKMGILNWHSANRLEQSSSQDHLRMSFVIRSVVTDYIAACALIIGGIEWARRVHYDMQIANAESFDVYVATITQGKAD